MGVFITKHKRLELVINPTFYETKDGKRIIHEGERIIFENGKFQTTDKKEMKFLLNHNEFNKLFYLQGKIFKCQYCGKYFQMKASQVTHEKFCKENPNRIIGRPDYLEEALSKKYKNKKEEKE